MNIGGCSSLNKQNQEVTNNKLITLALLKNLQMTKEKTQEEKE